MMPCLFKITKAQMQSLKVLYLRNTFTMSGLPKERYRDIRKRVTHDFGGGPDNKNIVVYWCGIHILILEDGSRHT